MDIVYVRIDISNNAEKQIKISIGEMSPLDYRMSLGLAV